MAVLHSFGVVDDAADLERLPYTERRKDAVKAALGKR
jgi:hypothetical protein